MNTQVFNNLVAFLDRLEQKCISYTLAHNREEAILVLVAVPGERWEIEFLRDGTVEVEKFVSTGEISDAESFSELFARYTDQEENAASTSETDSITSAAKIA